EPAGTGAAVDHGVSEALAPLTHGEHEWTVHRGLDLLVIRRLVDVKRHGDVNGDDISGLPRVIDFEIGGWGGSGRHRLAVDRDRDALGGPVGHADFKGGGLGGSSIHSKGDALLVGILGGLAKLQTTLFPIESGRDKEIDVHG